MSATGAPARRALQRLDSLCVWLDCRERLPANRSDKVLERGHITRPQRDGRMQHPCRASMPLTGVCGARQVAALEEFDDDDDAAEPAAEGAEVATADSAEAPPAEAAEGDWEGLDGFPEGLEEPLPEVDDTRHHARLQGQVGAPLRRPNVHNCRPLGCCRPDVHNCHPPGCCRPNVHTCHPPGCCRVALSTGREARMKSCHPPLTAAAVHSQHGLPQGKTEQGGAVVRPPGATWGGPPGAT
jgi:hypothetical protein